MWSHVKRLRDALEANEHLHGQETILRLTGSSEGHQLYRGVCVCVSVWFVPEVIAVAARRGVSAGWAEFRKAFYPEVGFAKSKISFHYIFGRLLN